MSLRSLFKTIALLGFLSFILVTGISCGSEDQETDDQTSTDGDGDGVPDSEDAFPDDPNESVDTDGDGSGNNADNDDDGDNTVDADDFFSTDSTESVDSDGDGTGNNSDIDLDGDGTLNAEDTDVDNDGIANTDDDDDDGDGTPDLSEETPAEVVAQTDGDGDGTTDADDTDDDNDGVLDEDDVFSDDPAESVDTDGDGIGDNTDSDDDGDDIEDTLDTDADGDGVQAVTDCNDNNAAIYPGATETCNSTDDDCDGTTDENDSSDATTWYADSDSDGYGDPKQTTTACTQPSDYVANHADCKDDNAKIMTKSTWHQDSDGDGFGNSSVTELSCKKPADYVGKAGDCDDTNSSVYLSATEICDNIDNDCDGKSDEKGATGETTWYADRDGDGYGEPSQSKSACTQPDGFVSDATDCDDTDDTVNTAATEICDSKDNNCDGSTDESSESVRSFYVDADGDGFGDSSATATTTTTDCSSAPSGSVENNSDCNDADSAINPDAVEVCDNGSVDENCDGSVTAGTLYSGALTIDSSNEANVSSILSGYCGIEGDLAIYTTSLTNLDDFKKLTTITYSGSYGGYLIISSNDLLTDTAGLSNIVNVSSVISVHHNDSLESISGFDLLKTTGQISIESNKSLKEFPDFGSLEKIDYLDIKENDVLTSIGGMSRLTSVESDLTFENNTALSDCDISEFLKNITVGGTTTISGNLADADCDGVSDADDAFDDNAKESEDNDGDGTGNNFDKDDDNDGVLDELDAFPEDATETKDTDGDGVGNNADALDFDANETVDVDSDGVGANTDCDDTNAKIFPGAKEICNGDDDNCDGEINEDLPKTFYYSDSDGDGYGEDGISIQTCRSSVEGWVADNTDCDDGNSGVNPGEGEECDESGLDEDCDGTAISGVFYDGSIEIDSSNQSDMGDLLKGYCGVADLQLQFTTLTNLDDLSELRKIGNLNIFYNNDLNDFSGLSNLRNVSSISFQGNNVLTDLTGLNNLIIAESITIHYFYNLQDISGFTSLKSIGSLEIDTNFVLIDISGFENLTKITDELTIDYNTDLTKISGFSSLTTVSGDLSITRNYDLTNCTIQDFTDNFTVGGTTTISGNSSVTDSDCDGVVDADDALPNDATESVDTDGDGIGNNADDDDDNDGVKDPFDAFPEDATESKDKDGDGYGSNTDCNELDKSIYPGQTETCNDLDDDCDGTVDDNPTDATTWYTDSDGDSYGDDDTKQTTCNVPINRITTGGDCDDGDKNINPAATESLDSEDNDCDGITDNVYLDDVADATMVGEKSYHLGMKVVSDGDYNCDGYDDIMVSSSEISSQRGYVWVVFGSKTKFSGALSTGDADITLVGENTGDEAGYSIANAGDINGDACDDMIIGAPGYDSKRGKAYLVYGGTSLKSGTTSNLSDVGSSLDGVVFKGEDNYDYAGFSVAAAGDVNDNGVDDLIIGAPFEHSSDTAAGKVYLIYGKSGSDAYSGTYKLSSSSLTTATYYGWTYYECGYAVLGIGDYDNDGHDDFAFSCMLVDDSKPSKGVVYVVLGGSGSDKPSGSNSFKASDYSYGSSDAGDMLGTALAKGGDVNGDGYADFLIGSSSYGDNGMIHVILGITSSGSSSYNSKEIEGASTNASAGSAVAGGADLNNDGYDDFLVGDNGYDEVGTDDGITYLIYGNSTFTGGSLDQVGDTVDGALFLGGSDSDSDTEKSGSSVAIGDLNNDGYADIIIGAPNKDDDSETDAGFIYIIYGSK